MHYFCGCGHADLNAPLIGVTRGDDGNFTAAIALCRSCYRKRDIPWRDTTPRQRSEAILSEMARMSETGAI